MNGLSSPIITIDKNETLAKASALIEEHKICHLAVTKSDNIIGMLLERYYCHLHDNEGETRSEIPAVRKVSLKVSRSPALLDFFPPDF